jgi:hypothetical protein
MPAGVDTEVMAGTSLGDVIDRAAEMLGLPFSLLRDLLRETDPADHDKFARRFDELTAQAAEPLYRATLWYDRHRLAISTRTSPARRTAPTIRGGRPARRSSRPASPIRTWPARTHRWRPSSGITSGSRGSPARVRARAA